MTPAELIDDYVTWLTHNRGRSSGTAGKYEKALQLLIEFLGGRDPRAATDDELVLFTGMWLHRRGVGPRARRAYVAAVRGFFKWAMATKRSQRNPAAALLYPNIGRPLPRVITLDNYEKLMWAPDLNTFEGVRDSAMIAVLGGCGIRVGGLVRLNAGDVIQQTIVDEKTGARSPRLFIRVREKGDKERMVPLPREVDLQLRVYMAHEALKEIDRALADGDQVLFVTTMNRRCPAHEYRGERRRFTRQSVNRLLLKYGEQAKVPRDQLNPHALRHLFGTELAEGKVDMKDRMDLMGHVDPKSAEVYNHLARRRLVAEIDRAGPLAKIQTPASDLLRSMQAAPPRKPTKA